MAKSSLLGSSLLRATLVSAAILAAYAPDAFARIGVTSATDGDPLGKPPQENERVLRIGIDVQANEVITTKANDRAHLVFLDGTSITVGPNAQMTLDKFVYDPDTKKGDLAITATKGVFRVVGGKISKTNAITVTTPSSTIGIRGGISIFTVTSTQTVSAFVFGQSLTNTSNTGQVLTLVRAGTQVVTSSNGVIGNPTAANVGGALGALEGTSGKGGGGNPDQQSQNSGFSGQNSGQGPTSNGPPVITSNVVSNTTQTVTNVINNTNPANQPPTQQKHVPVVVQTTTTNTQVTDTTTTQVIVTRGRFLQDPAYVPRTFNSNTLSARRDPRNNEALSPSGGTSSTTETTTVTTTTTTTSDGVPTSTTTSSSSSSVTSPTLATISVPNSRTGGGSLTLPWIPGQIFQFAGDTPFGLAHAIGLVSPNQDFFAYSFKVDSSGQIFVVFGGTPTTTAQFPKVGIGAQTLSNLKSPGNLPFAPDSVGGDAQLQAAANISPLYSVYTPNLNGTNASHPSVPDALQVTISIAGTGSQQKSYMGVFIANYGTDQQTGTVYSAGTFMDSYRLGANQQIGRGISNQSTADTGAGTAIYGDSGQYQVYIPDKVTTTSTGRGHGDGHDRHHHHSVTTRTTGAALDQSSANSRPTSYYPVTMATPVSNPNTLPSDLGQNRTTQTLNGYATGLIESSNGHSTTTITPNITFSRPTDVSISTDAATNQAMGTIVMRGINGTLLSPTLTLQLGGKSGPSGPTSAFIDDSRYAMITQKNDPSRQSTLQPIIGRSTTVNDNTLLASYQTAPVTLPGGVQPCTCEYLSWGFWSSNVNYGNGTTNNINLGTYVVGQVTTALQMPTMGSATFGGFMLGNVQNGSANYVGSGTYTSNWNFQSRSGSFNASFDGQSYNAVPKLFGSGSSITGIIAGGGRVGQVNGSFFNSPTQNAAYQGGLFTIGGRNYQAAGIFAGQRVP